MPLMCSSSHLQKLLTVTAPHSSITLCHGALGEGRLEGLFLRIRDPVGCMAGLGCKLDRKENVRTPKLVHNPAPPPSWLLGQCPHNSSCYCASTPSTQKTGAHSPTFQGEGGPAPPLTIQLFILKQPEDDLQESVLSFQHVGPRDRT